MDFWVLSRPAQLWNCFWVVLTLNVPLPPAGHETTFTCFPFPWSPSSRREGEISGISKLKLLEAPEMPPPLRSPPVSIQGAKPHCALMCLVNPSSRARDPPWI